MKISLDAQPITLTQILWVVVALTIFILGGLTWHYHGAYQSKSETLATLQQSVANQNQEAAIKLKALTAERDAKQAALNKQAKEQGVKDAIAQNGIARLNEQLRTSTVRVRVIPTSRVSSGSTTSDEATAAANRAADDTEASGVLPESNTRRLADALTEVETLSAAYNSCRALELPP